MRLTIEAIYEAGMLKPLSPLSDLNEHERVRITVEATSSVDDMQGKIVIDPAVSREIIESADYSVLEARSYAPRCTGWHLWSANQVPRQGDTESNQGQGMQEGAS